MKKLSLLMTLIALTFSLTACETMKGLGKDVEDAGEWVQEKAS